MRPDTLVKLQALRAQARSVALVTRIKDGAQALVCGAIQEGELALDAGILQEVGRCINTDSSGNVGDELFVRVYSPPRRMLLVGAVHISQELIKLAPSAGFRVTIIDPRTAFSSRERFPGANLLTQWPDLAITGMNPDGRTAIITLTHDPKLDDPALITALGSDAFFVGALGSRKTHAARLARLTAQGVADRDLARIHAPVGLALGGRRPGEIAVAILAQVIQAQYLGSKS